jgi:hypothetical protein
MQVDPLTLFFSVFSATAVLGYLTAVIHRQRIALLKARKERDELREKWRTLLDTGPPKILKGRDVERKLFHKSSSMFTSR